MEMKKYPSAADMIIKNTNVDDLVDSVKTIKEASNLANDVDHILKQVVFTVKHWTMSTVDQTRDGTKVQLIDPYNEIQANISKCHDNKETSLKENNAVL